MPPIDIPGITLAPSPLGGPLIERAGSCLGWIHRRDDQVYAYLRDAGTRGRPLGAYDTDELAIRAIVAAADASFGEVAKARPPKQP